MGIMYLTSHAPEDMIFFAGTVVPVGEGRAGRMLLLASGRWHPFVASINRHWVLANENRELFWYIADGHIHGALDHPPVPSARMVCC